MKSELVNGLSNFSPTGGGETGAVSIQGYEGSFHQVAAQHFFGKNIRVIPCATFREVIKVAASKKESDGGVMAIENSIAGSILPNYNLLQKSNLQVVGEVFLHIRQNLLVNPGVKLHDIKEVHSHPMAIQQCLEFLDKYDWKLVETEDTALSAKLLHQHRNRHAAAIASRPSSAVAANRRSRALAGSSLRQPPGGDAVAASCAAAGCMMSRYSPRGIVSRCDSPAVR